MARSVLRSARNVNTLRAVASRAQLRVAILAVSPKRCLLRPTRHTDPPAEAIASAIALPIPELAPVITALNSPGIGKLPLFCVRGRWKKVLMMYLHSLKRVNLAHILSTNWFKRVQICAVEETLAGRLSQGSNGASGKGRKTA
jgi:hypothetical protein